MAEDNRDYTPEELRTAAGIKEDVLTTDERTALAAERIASELEAIRRILDGIRAGMSG